MAAVSWPKRMLDDLLTRSNPKSTAPSALAWNSRATLERPRFYVSHRFCPQLTRQVLGVEPARQELGLKVTPREFGSWKLTLAAYNAGPGTVIKYGGVPPYQETQDYVVMVPYLYC